MTPERREQIDVIMCELPKDLFFFSRRAIDIWYNFGNRSLLNEASERIGIAPDEIIAWWDS